MSISILNEFIHSFIPNRSVVIPNKTVHVTAAIVTGELGRGFCVHDLRRILEERHRSSAVKVSALLTH